jgi:hypothetical protein
MSGAWYDAAPGQITLRWFISQNSGTGQQAITGVAFANDACGDLLSWNASGYYSAPTYNIWGTHASPATVTCNGVEYTTLNQYITGAVSANGSCGLGSGSYEGSIPPSGPVVIRGSNTMTVTNERIPSGETTTFSTWADQYGYPTVAVFNAALNYAGSSFNGRTTSYRD